MSKSLKKLIDINRLREFKNKLVGTGSAYVQTAAVDQTIAGTKTFSKPIVGSVTGNAATATTAATASSVPWSGVTGKPSSYTPAAHTQAASTITGLATVATSGSYTDLSNKPTIPVIDSALSATSTNGLQNKVIKTALDRKANSSHTHTKSQITDFPALATVATSGSYNDLTNKPAIPPAYSLPDATATVKGGVKIGSNITVSKGTVSLTKDNVVAALGYTPPTKDTNTWTAFKGATSSANGTAGYVPAPTKGNQNKFFKADGTWATPPNTTYASMSASEATTGTATAARTISAKVLHDKINSNLSAYATKTELNKGLTTKANNSEVVHKSGDETIAGTKTFSNGVLSTAPNALMAQCGEYTLVLRNDGDNTYLLMSDKGGVPGTWSDARPLVISNSTGVCDINGNAATATRANSADKAANADRAASAKQADHATSADSATKAIVLKSNSSANHEIRFDWSRQVDGRVGIRVDATDLGGIATTSGTYGGMTVGSATRATQDSDGNKISTTYIKRTDVVSYNIGACFIGFYSLASHISNIGNGGRLVVGDTTSASNLYDTITTASNNTVVCSRNITLAGVWRLISIIKYNVFSENYAIVESTHQAGSSFAAGVVAVQGLFVRVS